MDEITQRANPTEKWSEGMGGHSREGQTQESYKHRKQLFNSYFRNESNGDNV